MIASADLKRCKPRFSEVDSINGDTVAIAGLDLCEREESGQYSTFTSARSSHDANSLSGMNAGKNCRSPAVDQGSPA